MDVVFDSIEIAAFATNKAQARKIILKKLARKNPCSLIYKKQTDFYETPG
jgi:hypothetical protein